MLQYVRYTDNVPKGFGGMTVAFYVRILPKYKDDLGLLAHEIVHVNQFWVFCLMLLCWWPLGPSVFIPLCLVCILAYFAKWFKLHVEVDAYRVQLKFYPEKLDVLAGLLATRYVPGVSKEYAVALLAE